VSMRALGDPDAFLAGDVGIRHALERLGNDGDDAVQVAEGWRPWRSYAVMQLWRSLGEPARSDAGATAARPAPGTRT
jgi:AraC family transcriptional regulator, regulatory protein of adaptative response / DNA-3-methyladenine glycosylase II